MFHVLGSVSGFAFRVQTSHSSRRVAGTRRWSRIRHGQVVSHMIGARLPRRHTGELGEAHADTAAEAVPRAPAADAPQRRPGVASLPHLLALPQRVVPRSQFAAPALSPGCCPALPCRRSACGTTNVSDSASLFNAY